MTASPPPGPSKEPTGPALPPPPPAAGPPAPPADPRRQFLTSKPFIAVAALTFVVIIAAAIASTDKQDSTATPSVATPTTVATSVAASPPPAPPSTKPSAPATRAQVPSAKKSYQGLSSRKFKLLAKDPDSYIGKTYLIYGEVTQFDAATGTEGFRANTGPTKLRISYGYVSYDQNSVLSGTTSRLAKLVEGDCFSAKVTVLGSYSYDTQLGGSTTVPMFQVDSIKVYGSTS